MSTASKSPTPYDPRDPQPGDERDNAACLAIALWLIRNGDPARGYRILMKVRDHIARLSLENQRNLLNLQVLDGIRNELAKLETNEEPQVVTAEHRRRRIREGALTAAVLIFEVVFVTSILGYAVGHIKDLWPAVMPLV